MNVSRQLTLFIVGGLVACGFAGRAPAQGLTFSHAGDPPPLPEFTAALALARDLDSERINRAAATDIVDPSADLAATVSMRMRETLAAALRWCHEQGPQADIMFVAFAHIAANRDLIDAALATSLAHGQSTAQAREAARRFLRANEQVASSLQTTDPNQFDAAAAAFVAPLIELAGQATPAARVWPSAPLFAFPAGDRATAPSPSSGVDDAFQPPANAAELRARLESAPLLHPHTQLALLEHVARVETAQRHVDLWPRSRELIGLLSLISDAAVTLNSATWLTDEEKQNRLERVNTSVSAALGRSEHTPGPAVINALRAHLALVRRINALAAMKVEVRKLVAVEATVDEMLSSPERAAIAAEQLPILLRVFDRMIATHELRTDAMRRSDLRQAYERLLREALRAEVSVLDVLERIATDPTAGADAAIGTLLADHAQLVEDVRRVRNVDAWIDRMARINPRAETGFHNQIRRACTMLSDLNRRDDAVRAMDSLQRQLAWFYPLPLEDKLTALDRDMIELTGGSQQELRNLINTVRAEWADAWALGDASSEAGNRLLRLLHLLRAAEEALSLQDGRVEALNAWGPWSVPAAALDQPLRDLSGFLKLAIAAAVMNDWPEVARHLQAADSAAPVARLAGRLRITLEPVLTDVASSSRAPLVKHAQSPDADAFLIDNRADVAHLCRHLAELQFARASGNRELTTELQDYVNAVARDLLRALDQPPELLPDIPAFEGQ